MPNSNFIIGDLITLRPGCHPVLFLNHFRIAFPKNNSGGLLLQEVAEKLINRL